MKSQRAIEFIEDRKAPVCHFPEEEYVVSDLDAEQAVDLAERQKGSRFSCGNAANS